MARVYPATDSGDVAVYDFHEEEVENETPRGTEITRSVLHDREPNTAVNNSDPNIQEEHRSDGLKQCPPRTPIVSYETVMWKVHITICLLACLDRFYWNSWPRETYTIGKGSAGTDRRDLKEGPWSVKLFDVIARVSGRYSIVTMNLLFLVRLRTIESWLSRSWISKYLMDCSNIVQANLRLHICNGVLFSVLILMHVWSILLPCVFHRYGVQVVPGYFEYPLSERAPPGFKDADHANKMMSLQIDDVFRMVEMSLVLGIMIPLSKYWFKRRYHIALHMHRVAAVIVFIDIARRHSHPHSIILNTPVFLIWIVEKIIITTREENVETFHRLKLGDEYMVIFWNSAKKLSKSVGPNFYLRLKDSSVTEPPHAFTSFQNRVNFSIDNSHCTWNSGIVMRVYHNKRPLPLSSTDNVSHTSRLFNCKTDTSALEVSGPFNGEMSQLIHQARSDTLAPGIIQNPKSRINGCLSNPHPDPGPSNWASSRSASSAVVLIGTGSGVNYLIDALQHPSAPGTKDLIVLWSTRDSNLYYWVSSVMCDIMTARSSAGKLRVVLSNTDKMNGVHAYNTANHDTVSAIKHTSGRIDFEREIPAHSQVFFQGSSGVGRVVRAVCRRNGSEMFKGTGGKEVDNAARRLSGVVVNRAAVEMDLIQQL